MVSKNNTLAIIPARGGSKRIPGKNIYPFMGMPLVAWTIKAAQNSGLFDHILVSTDSEEVAEVSIKYGAEVPFLRSKHADDHSTASEAAIHALLTFEKYSGKIFDHITLLLPTCPLRDHSVIEAEYDYQMKTNAPSVLSCYEYGFMNPWWAHALDRNGIPTTIFPEGLKRRSQDNPPLYCPSGAVWMAWRQPLLEANSFYAKGHHFFPIDWKYAVDIDTMDDIDLATVVYQLLNQG